MRIIPDDSHTTNSAHNYKFTVHFRDWLGRRAPAVGSDEWMEYHGFHLSTPEEIEKYGKFKRESWWSILWGCILRIFRH